MTGAVQAMFAAGLPGTTTPPVQIAPSAFNSASMAQPSNTSSFTATFTGGAPSSIVWSVEDIVDGTAQVFSGQGTATAQIRVTATNAGVPVSCTVRCTAVIAGVTQSGTATKSHDWDNGTGGIN